MKTTRFLSTAILIAFATTACQPSTPGGTGGTDSSAHGDTLPPKLEVTYELIQHDMAECDKLKPNEFCFQGFSFMKIGDTLAWKTLKLKDCTEKDTVFSDEAMTTEGMKEISWNVKMLTYKDGKVILESDFDTGWVLNRIRVQTPRYINKEGARVGMTMAELRPLYKNLYARTLEDEGEALIEVFADDHQFFHFENNGIVPKGTGNLKPEQIPATASIKRIVVM